MISGGVSPSPIFRGGFPGNPPEIYGNFYYCIEPSKMILFNYPKDKNDQLLEKPIDYETFYNTAKLYINYFNLKIEKDNIK